MCIRDSLDPTTRHAMAGGWAWLDIAHRRWAARDRAAGARVRMRIRIEDEKMRMRMRLTIRKITFQQALQAVIALMTEID